MWKQLGDYVTKVFYLQQDTQKNKADIAELRQEVKELRQELRALTAAMQQIATEIVYDRRTAGQERENLFLRLEVQMLKFERRLPPPESGANEGTDG